MHDHHGTRTRRLPALALLACLLATAAGCNQGNTRAATGDAEATTTRSTERAAGPVQSGGQLTIGIAADTDSFNPFVGQWSIPSYEVANAIFEPLAAVDELGIARPYLAESITPGEGFRSWSIEVRPNVVFHNGEPFDAAALKKNLDRARTSGLTAQVFTIVTGVEIATEDTVTVTMSQPWATFPATLAMQSGYMAAPAMLDDPAAANATPIGTGPFAVQDRVRDSFVKTKRNPSYWRVDRNGTRLPYLDAVEFQIIPDASARANAMAAGNVDAVDALTPDALQTQIDAAGQGTIQVITSDGQESDETVLALNTSRPPFDDPIARQALAYGIDQEKLSATAYRHTFEGAWGMFDEDSPYYISKAEAGYPEPDADKARQLAEQYQQAHGTPLEFTSLLPPDPQYLAIGQTLQQMLADVGIKANLQAIEQTELIRTVVASGDYQASGFVLRSAPSPDQANVFLATKANPAGLSLNFARLDDPALTAAMGDFRAAAEPAARVDAVKKVQQSLARNLPMIFLVHVRAGFVYQNHVHGMQATTYPDTEKPAFSPYPNTPFFANAWKEPAG